MAKKVVLKKIDVLSLAKIQAVIMVILGLIYGIIFGIIGGAMFALGGSPALGFGVGLLAVIIMPIIFGILGFILGAVIAFLYNVIAERIGGIKLEVG